MLHRFYVLLATCTRVPALADDPFVTPDDLYAALHAAGIGFTITERAIAAAPAPDVTASLNLPTGAPVLITRRALHDTDGHALAMEETHRNADDVQLTYTIIPTTPQTTSPTLSPTPSAAHSERPRSSRTAG